MLDIELHELINTLKSVKTETDNVEAKAAKDGCPNRLYDK